ncbi:hypothetical protein [Dactylosporangium sp. NPDC000521]|uniref:hypothetical protein n=1 Tax=Dactylosporangium sp. NPDC000521 TaxID=3363975 RepID=UPI00367F9422
MGTATAARAARAVLACADAPTDVDDDDAAVLLHGYAALTGRDPATQLPGAGVIEAALGYARVAAPAADAFLDATVWAMYAYRAARTLHGVYHLRTVEATEVLIWVLYSRGLDREASTLRRDLIQLHLDHGAIAAHLTGRVDLASQLHSAGRCAAAVREAVAGWNAWTERFGEHDPAGLTLILQLAGMLTGCRSIPDALRRVEQARRLWPKPGDPAHRHATAFVGTLLMAAAQHRFVCTAAGASGGQPDAVQVAELLAGWSDLLP